MAEGPLESILALETFLLANFQARRIAIAGPGMDSKGKILKWKVT